jgi:hypothetical protein
MIMLASVTWSYLYLVGIFVPQGADLVGPMKPSVCKELRDARRHADLHPVGECITIDYPKAYTR